MDQLPGSAYKRWILTMMLLCAATGLAIVGSMMVKDGRLKIPFLAGIIGAGEPSTRMIYVTEFTECGDELREVKSVPVDDVPSLLATLPKEWTVANSGDAEVELRQRVQGYCGEHLRYRLITLYRGYVCVFRGKDPDPRFIVKGILGVREADLMQQVREDLRKGFLLEAGQDVPDEQVDDWFGERVAIELEGIKEH